MELFTPEDPHGSSKTIAFGASLEQSKQIILLLHGRGATAQSMKSLGDAFELNHTTFIAPQATEYTWYPYSFVAPEAMNQPWIDSALHLLENQVQRLSQFQPITRISLIGFSQGACLATEFAARSGHPFHLVGALSGGLIGEEFQTEKYSTSLNGQHYFLGCSDSDPHIPLSRVEESATFLSGRGATVEKRIYPNMGHFVNEDELGFLKNRLAEIED